MEGTKTWPTRDLSRESRSREKAAYERARRLARHLEQGHPNVVEMLAPSGLTLAWAVKRDGQPYLHFRTKLAAIRQAERDSFAGRGKSA